MQKTATLMTVMSSSIPTAISTPVTSSGEEESSSEATRKRRTGRRDQVRGNTDVDRWIRQTHVIRAH